MRFGGRLHCERPQDSRLTLVGPAREELIRYDRTSFPASRFGFLRCWLEPQRWRALALIEEGSVRGYGVIRACRIGFKIGPLFADTPEGAELLFRGLAAGAQGEPVFLDCPEPNEAATNLAIRHGLSTIFETARMYRGSAPELPLFRTLGITSFELG